MRVSFPLLIQAATIPLAAATLRICQDKGLSGQCLDNETALGICVTGWSRWSGDRGSSFKVRAAYPDCSSTMDDHIVYYLPGSDAH